MNLEYVSVENSKYHRKYCPPGLDKSTASLTYPPPLRQAEVDEPRVANPEIDRVLQRLSDKGLCGEAHVTQYLLYLHRRNCRPNTIRSNGSTITLFLTFLTSIGRNHLESITREDFSAFIDREQIGISQPFRAFGKKAFARAFLCWPALDSFSTHVACPIINLI